MFRVRTDEAAVLGGGLRPVARGEATFILVTVVARGTSFKRSDV